MPVTYSSQYRRLVLAQVRAGRSVYDLAEQLEVSASTIFRCKKQDQIDAGAVDETGWPQRRLRGRADE